MNTESNEACKITKNTFGRGVYSKLECEFPSGFFFFFFEKREFRLSKSNISSVVSAQLLLLINRHICGRTMRQWLLGCSLSFQKKGELTL